MAAGKNIDFTHRFHDERERAAQGGPAHGLGGGRISVREANSVWKVRLTVSPHPPFCAHLHVLCGRRAGWCSHRRQHAGGDSTVKMVTIGQEQLHKAGQGQVPPGRRICNGRAGRRCRQRLSLCAGCNALHLGCARLDQRAFRPPAAVCYGTCLARHLKEVLRCSWLVLDRVWCQIVVILVILCVRHNIRCSYIRFECSATFGGPIGSVRLLQTVITRTQTHTDLHEDQDDLK